MNNQVNADGNSKKYCLQSDRGARPPDKLSSSLKERLKRCGRYHSSPKLTPAKACPNSESENSTPTRKRSLSSPLLCGQQKRRQILHTLEQDNEKVDDASPDYVSKTVTTTLSLENSELDSSKTSSLNDKVDNLDCDQTSKLKTISNSSKERHDTVVCNPTDEIKQETVATTSSPTDDTQLKDNGDELCRELREKEETLRQLKMVQMYRSKNDLDQLQSLIDKWRCVVQQALPDLHAEMTGEPKPSLTQLIDHLAIDHSFIGYDPEEETFG